MAKKLNISPRLGLPEMKQECQIIIGSPVSPHVSSQEREAERAKSGGGQVFFMRNKEDISAKDGRLTLFEYTEEHPLLLSCIGMASRLDLGPFPIQALFPPGPFPTPALSPYQLHPHTPSPTVPGTEYGGGVRI